MKGELKPCPFCGSLKYVGVFLHNTKGFVVRCVSCGARVGYYETRKEAVDTWNKRTQRKTRQ